jgi:hypothetical protein
MNGVTGPLTNNNRAVAKVVSDINNMNSAIDLLGAHKQYILDKQLKRFNVDESDSIIKLVENSNNARLMELKLEAFNDILQFRRTGKGPQLAFDSHQNLGTEHIAPPAPPLRPNKANGGIQENPFEISSEKCPTDNSRLIFNSIVSHWFCPKCRKTLSDKDLSLKRGTGWPKGCLVYFVIFALLIAWLLIWGKP